MITQDQERLYEKMRALLRLSKEGVGAERGNAESLMKKFMVKYDLELEDFDPEAKPKLQSFKFVYKDQWSKDLLIQVIAKILDSWTMEGCSRYRGAKGVTGRTIVVECTVSQAQEIKYLYDLYLKDLMAKVNAIWPAFLQKNNLYPDSPMPEELNTKRKGRKMTQAEWDELQKAMETMTPTAVNKALPNAT